MDAGFAEGADSAIDPVKQMQQFFCVQNTTCGV
jgi:hypothetical protein